MEHELATSRSELYVPLESIPIPLQYIDVMRYTHTSTGNAFEEHEKNSVPKRKVLVCPKGGQGRIDFRSGHCQKLFKWVNTKMRKATGADFGLKLWTAFILQETMRRKRKLEKTKGLIARSSNTGLLRDSTRRQGIPQGDFRCLKEARKEVVPSMLCAQKDSCAEKPEAHVTERRSGKLEAESGNVSFGDDGPSNKRRKPEPLLGQRRDESTRSKRHPWRVE